MVTRKRREREREREREKGPVWLTFFHSGLCPWGSDTTIQGGFSFLSQSSLEVSSQTNPEDNIFTGHPALRLI
jgi:hypothetical protein